MPRRVLRPGIVTSEAVNQLSSSGEVFYRRLMSVVDDWGRYDGRTAILRSALYSLQLDRVREADIPRWIAECEKAGLLVLYHVEGKPFVQMLKWDLPRAKHSNWPHPPDAVRANVFMCAQTSPYSDTDTDTDTSPPKSPKGDVPGFDRFWSAYPKTRKVNRKGCLKKWESLKCEVKADAVLAGLKRWLSCDQWTKDDGRFVCAPLVWLTQERWEADVAPADVAGDWRREVTPDVIDCFLGTGEP